MIILSFYVLSVLTIAPFFSEDFSTKTEIKFVEVYSMFDQLSKLVVVLAQVFLSDAKSLTLVILVYATHAAVLVRYSDSICTFAEVAMVKATFSAMLAWAGAVSMYAGSLPVRQSRVKWEQEAYLT